MTSQVTALQVHCPPKTQTLHKVAAQLVDQKKTEKKAIRELISQTSRSLATHFQIACMEFLFLRKRAFRKGVLVGPKKQSGIPKYFLITRTDNTFFSFLKSIGRTTAPNPEEFSLFPRTTYVIDN